MSSKDFVEIYPVRAGADGFEPVYSDAARAPSTVSVSGPGSLHIVPNLSHVAGAYENLRHYPISKEIEAMGLTFACGETHLLEITPALCAGVCVERLVPATGEHYLTGELAGVLGAAARAGMAVGATHVEIKIS